MTIYAALCRLTAFVLAREEPAEACRLTPLSSGSALGPCMYDKGVSQAETLHCTSAGGALFCCLLGIACLAISLQAGVAWPPRSVACLQFNHTFPRQGAPDSEQIILDLTRLDVQKLSAAEGTSYPLVLRLETISAKGLEEGHTLQVRPGSICFDPVF